MTATPPIISEGVLITIGSTAPGEVKSIGTLSMSAETIDVTTHGPSRVRQFIGGMVDLGSIDIVVRYDKTAVSGLYSDLATGTSKSVVVTFPFTTSETLTFSAIVSGLNIDISNGSELTASITLKLDGQTVPTWA